MTEKFKAAHAVCAREIVSIEDDHFMTMAEIESAIARGAPFSIQMADGKQYNVPHPDYISLPPKGSFVVVFDDDDHAFVLPLLTMAELTQKTSGAGAS